MLHLHTLVWYLLFQGRGGVSEKDAVRAPQMIHLNGQALETLLTLLAGVALLGREHDFLLSFLCDLQTPFIKHFIFLK